MSARGPNRHRLFVGKDVHKFSCAHMTVFPDGSKERIHGHNFRVSLAIELLGPEPDLLDFAWLKKAMQAQCDEWTERLLLPGASSELVIVRRDQQELEFRRKTRCSCRCAMSSSNRWRDISRSGWSSASVPPSGPISLAAWKLR
jgi:hypothetical protein